MSKHWFIGILVYSMGLFANGQTHVNWSQVVLHDYEQLPVSTILQDLYERFDLPLSFGGSDLIMERTLTINGNNRPLSSVFKELINKGNLRYEVVEGHLIIHALPSQPDIPKRPLLQVIDAISGEFLEGVYVRNEVDDAEGTLTDSLGLCFWDNPATLTNLVISHIGFQSQHISLTPKDSFPLTVLLEPNPYTFPEVWIMNLADDQPATPPFTTLSAISFNLQQSSHFPASFSDISRVVMNYAGITHETDIMNQLVVRGHSPKGIQWHLDGVEIPNPNHFAEAGAGGGGINAISSQLLEQVDFLHGAFPAQYGNLTSGAFNLQLRRGSTDRTHHRLSLGLLSNEFTTEGPFKKGGKASYIANLRLASFSLLDDLGINPLGEVEPPSFQDLAIYLNFPSSKWGNLSLFGLTATSHSREWNAVPYTKELDGTSHNWRNKNDYFLSLWQLTHKKTLGDNWLIKNTLSLAMNSQVYQEDSLDSVGEVQPIGDHNIHLSTLVLATTLNYYAQANWRLQSGVSFIHQPFDFDIQDIDVGFTHRTSYIDAQGSTYRISGYTQAELQLIPRWTFVPGIHMIHYGQSLQTFLEPRLGLRWKLKKNQWVSFGAGLFSKMEPLAQHFLQTYDDKGEFSLPNEHLGVTRSWQMMLGYERQLSSYLQLKLEAYYHRLFDIPVSNEGDLVLSSLNASNAFIISPIQGVVPLENNGNGKNYGIDVTLDGKFSSAFMLATLSIYQAKFNLGRGPYLNSRFNGNFASSLKIGKEFTLGRNNVLLSMTVFWNGGQRYTPIDLSSSRLFGTYIEDKSQIFTSRVPAYLRWDSSARWERKTKKGVQALTVDIQNMTNHRNILNMGGYNQHAQDYFYTYHSGLLPVLSYEWKW